MYTEAHHACPPAAPTEVGYDGSLCCPSPSTSSFMLHGKTLTGQQHWIYLGHKLSHSADIMPGSQDVTPHSNVFAALAQRTKG